MTRHITAILGAKFGLAHEQQLLQLLHGLDL
jgi:hypothetical protein